LFCAVLIRCNSFVPLCPRLKNFWQRLMRLVRTLFQNFHPNLERYFASTKAKVLSILLMDFVRNATTR
jgi:hypothetical protein